MKTDMPNAKSRKINSFEVMRQISLRPRHHGIEAHETNLNAHWPLASMQGLQKEEPKAKELLGSSSRECSIS